MNATLRLRVHLTAEEGLPLRYFAWTNTGVLLDGRPTEIVELVEGDNDVEVPMRNRLRKRSTVLRPRASLRLNITALEVYMTPEGRPSFIPGGMVSINLGDLTGTPTHYGLASYITAACAMIVADATVTAGPVDGVAAEEMDLGARPVDATDLYFKQQEDQFLSTQVSAPIVHRVYSFRWRDGPVDMPIEVFWVMYAVRPHARWLSHLLGCAARRVGLTPEGAARAFATDERVAARVLVHAVTALANATPYLIDAVRTALPSKAGGSARLRAGIKIEDHFDTELGCCDCEDLTRLMGTVFRWLATEESADPLLAAARAFAARYVPVATLGLVTQAALGVECPVGDAAHLWLLLVRRETWSDWTSDVAPPSGELGACDVLICEGTGYSQPFLDDRHAGGGAERAALLAAHPGLGRFSLETVSADRAHRSDFYRSLAWMWPLSADPDVVPQTYAVYDRAAAGPCIGVAFDHVDRARVHARPFGALPDDVRDGAVRALYEYIPPDYAPRAPPLAVAPVSAEHGEAPPPPVVRPSDVLVYVPIDAAVCPHDACTHDASRGGSLCADCVIGRARADVAATIRAPTVIVDAYLEQLNEYLVPREQVVVVVRRE